MSPIHYDDPTAGDPVAVGDVMNEMMAYLEHSDSRRAALRSMPYHEYLRTPEWRMFRRQMVHKARGRCERCGSRWTLNVHHLTYARRGMEDDADVLVLCHGCHMAIHRDQKTTAASEETEPAAAEEP